MYTTSFLMIGLIITIAVLLSLSHVRCSEQSQILHALLHKKRKDEFENSVQKDFVFYCVIFLPAKILALQMESSQRKPTTGLFNQLF